MGWTNFPPTADQPTANSWAWHDQLRQALLEKYQAINLPHYPRTAHIWGTAVITGQGVDGRGWYIDFSPALQCDLYESTVDLVADGYVTQWRVVVDDTDPRKVVRLGPMSIDSFPVGHGATSDRLYLTPPPAHHPDYLDYGSLVGKTFFIITGYSDADNPFWHERIPQPPNDVITAAREVHEGGALTCGPGMLVDTTIGDRAADYADQHLWIDSDRFAIDAITGSTISFSNDNVDPLPTLSEGDPYIVVHAEGFYKPGNEFYCWRWHDVPNGTWYAHDHTLADGGFYGGQVGTTSLRALTVRVKEQPVVGEPCPTIGEPRDVTETDVWIGIPNRCEIPDSCKTPYFYRTLRGTQIAALNVAQSFVKNVDYTGSKAIPQFVPATWFAEAGINVLTLTGTAPVFDIDHWEVSVNAADFDAFPVGVLDDDGVWWALVDTTWGNTVIASGRAYQASDIPATITIPCDIPRTAANGSHGIISQQENVTSDPWEYGTPHTVVWKCSAGWTRKRPAEFRYAYEHTSFVPELYQEEVGEPPVMTTLVADPPTAERPGIYDVRPASTHLLRPDLQGRILESTFDYDEITDGMLAQYMGDSANDPGLTITEYEPPAAPNRRLLEVVSGDHSDGTLAPRLWYADQFRTTVDFQGRVGDNGEATSGGTTFLTDTTKLWWPQGSLITHTGTAIGGTATSLTATTDGFWTNTKTDSSGRFQGMVVEVNTSGTVWEKRLIDAHSGGDLSWEEPLSTSASGKPFRIVEPKGRLNYWRGRTVTLTSPGGDTVYNDVPILGSDDDTLFFEAQAAAIGAGWTYTIYEMQPGAVYERVAGEWVLPADALGSDKRAKKLHPDVLTRYGYIRKQDHVTATLYSELRTGLDLLVATKNGAPVWSHQDESNQREGDGTGIDTTYAAARATAEANVTAGPPGWDFDLGPTPGSPFSGGVTAVNSNVFFGGWKVDIALARRYSYPTKTTLPTYLTGSVDFYVYGATRSGGFNFVDEAPGIVDEDSFNAYGDPVTYHTWNKFDTQSISNNVLGAKFGSLTQPYMVNPTLPDPDPGTGDITTNGSDGYSILQAESICRWDMQYHA